MAIFTKVEFNTPSKLFWFADQIKWRSYNLTLNHSSRTVVDNVATSPLDFPYLISSVRPYISKGKNTHAEVYRPARFSWQLG